MPIIIESKISHQFTQSPKENKNERRIKLENHRFSFVTIQANPSLFEIGENRQSTIRGQNSGRVYSSSHSHPLSPGQLLAPDLLLFEVEKAGVLERGRSWGTSVSSSFAQIEVALPWPGVAEMPERIENPRNRSRRRGSGWRGRGRAPILSPGTSRRRRRCSTPIRVELRRHSPPSFSPSFLLLPPLSLSLLLFATHATLVGSLDPCPFEGRGFPLFPFSAATVTSTLSISPKADANEHMEVTWKYDVDVARRENGKGDDGLVKKAVTVTWIWQVSARKFYASVHVFGIIGLLPDRSEDISFFSFSTNFREWNAQRIFKLRS